MIGCAPHTRSSVVRTSAPAESAQHVRISVCVCVCMCVLTIQLECAHVHGVFVYVRVASVCVCTDKDAREARGIRRDDYILYTTT